MSRKECGMNEKKCKKFISCRDVIYTEHSNDVTENATHSTTASASIGGFNITRKATCFNSYQT